MYWLYVTLLLLQSEHLMLNVCEAHRGIGYNWLDFNKITGMKHRINQVENYLRTRLQIILVISLCISAARTADFICEALAIFIV